MRYGLLSVLVSMAACEFTPPAAPLDGSVDGSLDAMVDGPIDTTPSERAGTPIALWLFTETSGVMVTDSTSGSPIPLTLVATSMVTQSGGGLTFNARSMAVSAATPHVNADVEKSGAVTLEAWVTPANDTQGELSYSVIASISPSIMLRNIGLEQRGNSWVGRVRTATTTGNADPVITAVAVDLTNPTHLVLVTDATTRTLYVNGILIDEDANGGGLVAWDPNYKIRVGDEDGSNRAWLGTIWLLAMYDKALSSGEVMQNYLAGHDCTTC